MSLNNVLRYIIVGGLFFVPLTLLVVSSSLFFPFITGKAFFFRILIEILFGTWIALMIFDPVYRPKNSGLLMGLGGLLLILIAATVFGENPYRSFWSNFERMEGLITFLHLFAYFVILISIFKRERLWHWFFHTFFGVGVILALYSLLQLVGWVEITQGANRITATLGNASYLAVTFLWLIFLSLVFFVDRGRSSKIVRASYLLFILVQTFFLFQTQTRGAVLGFIAGLAITFSLIAWRERANIFLRRFAISSLVLMIVLVIGFLLVKDQVWVRNNLVLSRLSSISLSGGQSRFIIWNMALKGFQEKPILGWGPENFNLVFDKYYDPRLYNQEQWFDRAHNIFLDWLIHAGLLGLVAYLSLFVLALYYIWQSQNFSLAKKSIFSGLIVAYFFHNIFVFDHLASYLFFFTFLAYLHVDRIASTQVSRPEPQPLEPSVSRWSLAAVGGLVIIMLIYVLNIKPLVANRQIIRVLSSPSPLERFEIFQKLATRKTFASTEAVEQLPNIVSAVFSQPDTDPAVMERWLQLTSNFAAAEQVRAQTARLPYMMGILFNHIGQLTVAVEQLEQARTLSPRKQSILLALAPVYYQIGEKEKALLIAKEAYELELRNDEARTIYAVLAILENQPKLADDLLKNNPLPDTRIINAYAEQRQYNKVLELWRQLVNQNPQNVQYRFSLAATYLQLGERQQAIKTLEETAVIYPTTKPQVDYLVNEIRAGRNPAQ